MPEFLTVEDVLDLHQQSAARYGGSDRVLDLAKVESAVAQPRQQFGGAYLHEGVAAMAAAYLFHICKNHGFEDGNKRPRHLPLTPSSF